MIYSEDEDAKEVRQRAFEQRVPQRQKESGRINIPPSDDDNYGDDGDGGDGEDEPL